MVMVREPQRCSSLRKTENVEEEPTSTRGSISEEVFPAFQSNVKLVWHMPSPSQSDV